MHCKSTDTISSNATNFIHLICIGVIFMYIDSLFCNCVIEQTERAKLVIQAGKVFEDKTLSLAYLGAQMHAGEDRARETIAEIMEIPTV